MTPQPCNFTALKARRHGVIQLVLALGLMACPSLVHAQQDWVGGTSGNSWFTGGNWTGSNPGNVPTSSDEVIIDVTNPANIKNPGAVASYVLVGNTASGTLQLSAGGTLNTGVDGNSTGLYIGYGANSSGTVSLTGNGTSLSANSGNGNITIGAGGNGALIIRNGATVSDFFGEIGQGPGTDTVLVSGTNAAWNNGLFLVVGDSGTGSLMVQGGATASTNSSSGNGILIGNGSTGVGFATVTGSGSFLNGSNGLQNITVGNGGAGNLTISNQGTALGAFGQIGYASGSSGSVTVTGSGSSWTSNNTLSVGGQGTGTLTVTKGGTIATGEDSTQTGLYINSNNSSAQGVDDANSDTMTVDGKGSTVIVGVSGAANLNVGFRGNGSLTISGSGSVIDQNAFLGYGGTSSSIDVTGNGSTWTNSGYIAINTGSLTVEKGGTVTTGAQLLIGNDFSNNSGVTENSGTVTITGSGSSLTVNNGNGTTYVGNNGNGTLIVSNGGTLTDNLAYIGENVGSTGNAVINGGTWTNNGTVVVGDNSTGTLTVKGGGTVTTGVDGVGVGLYISNIAGSSGAVTVTGTGSTLTVGANGTANIEIGFGDQGSLTISGSGTVIDNFAFVGYGGSGSTVDVTGTGSTWTNKGAIAINNGSVMVEKGATVTTGAYGNGFGVLVGNDMNTSGTLTVTGSGSNLTVDGGNGALVVGNNGNGTLNINNSGTVTDQSAYIGEQSGSTGFATVNGGTWTSSGSMVVGDNVASMQNPGATTSSGTLLIKGGGTVITGADGSNIGLYIGNNVGGTGVVTVTGTGSTLTVGTGFFGALVVGNNGSGNLLITNGGTVTTRVDGSNVGAYIGDQANSTGTVTVSGAGSNLTVGGGGVGTLDIGYAGSGLLTVSGSGSVTDYYASIGGTSTGSGTVDVTGTGSTWTNLNSVTVGDAGSGTLIVEKSGTVTTGVDGSNVGLYIGNQANSTGTVTVMGSGSSLSTGGGDLIVGNNGNGSLVINNAGLVSDNNASIGGTATGSGTGTVNVSGIGSTWANTRSLTVGNSGSGTLTVSSGGTVTTGEDSSGVGLYVGNQVNSIGSVTVTGSGTSLTTNGGNVIVGNGGNGSLTISGSGSVSDGFASIGGTSTGSGTVNVTGVGSTWTNSKAVTVGDAGNGTLTIRNGATVTTGVDGSDIGLYIANQGNSTGAVTVTGSGSLTIGGGGGDIVVGNGGNGSLTISGTGSVSNNNASIGGASTGSGTVDVSGIGATWTNSKLVTVGDAGSGTLIVEKGGTVTTGVDNNDVGLLVGNQGNSTGTVTVTGSGSSLTVGGGGGDVVIGNAGSASLTITNGASVTDRSAFIGEGSSTSIGFVDVNGTGSTWTNNGSISLAESGTATLLIEKNGQVSASSILISDHSGATGLLQIGNNNQSGTLTTSSIQFGSGTATLEFDQTNSTTINASISGSGTVLQQGSGTTILSGSNTYTGTTYLNGGILSVSANNNLGSDSGTLAFNGGTLENTASFTSGHAVVLNTTGTFQTDNGTTLTLSNTISGTGSLSKTKNGTLILSGANTYSGGTILNAGTISVSTDNNLGDDSGTLTFNAGTLQNTGSFTTSRAITLNGTGTFETDADLTLTGSISGAGSLTKTGTSSLILDAANTYSGGTTLADGTLVIGNSNALGTGALTTLDPTVVYVNGVNVANPIIMMGNTTLEVENTDSATQSGTISELGGSFLVTKTGSGTLLLTGTNTYSGGTNIKAGILAAATNAALGTGDVTVRNGATLDIDGTMGGVLIVTNNITISGTGTTPGQGALIATGTNVISGATGTVTLAAAATVANYGTNTGFVLGAVQLGSHNLTVGSGAVFFDGGITGSGGLIVDGSAVIQLGTNTYTGLTDVMNGGNLYLLDVGTTSITGNLRIEDGGVVTDGTSNQLSNSTVVTMNGTSVFNLTNSFFPPAINEQFAGLNSTSATTFITTTAGTSSVADSITLDGTDNYSFAGAITDSTDATLALIMAGTGKQTLTGTSTYHGGTFLNAGTLSVSADNNLGNASGTLTFNGGTLETTASFISARLVTLNDSGTFAVVGGTTLTLNNTISGTGSLSKTRNGILVLSGTNTYSGGTTISSGVIRAKSNDALGTGDVTVDSDATLTLNGDITVANNISITGTGTKGQGAIHGSGNSADPGVSGTVTLTGDASVGSTGTLTSLTLSDIQLGTNTLTTQGGTVTLVGSISGTGGLDIANVTQIVNGTNTFTGLTDVKASGTLVLADTNAPAIPGDLTIEDGGLAVDLTGTQLSSTTLLTINGTGAFVLDSTLTGSSVSESIAGLVSSSGSASITTSSPTLVADSITLTGTGSYNFAGIISDTGSAPLSLTIASGSGTQTLSGSNTYHGGTTLTSGALVVANSNALGAGDVTVNGGILSTDGINHTINVGGNYTQGANGTLMLSLFSPTVYDTVTLTGTGTANLNGTLNLNIVGSFAPGNGDTFTLMSTNNAVTGSFSTVTTNLPSLTGTIDYTDNVTLLFQGSFVNIPGLNLNPNQIAVATYIDNHDKFITNPDFAALVGALNSVSNDNPTLEAAFNQLMTVNFANFASSNAFNNASFMTQQLDSYLANHRGADGAFVGSQGGIDYTGLAVNNPEVDPALQSVRSRLLAWSPAASTGLLSDSSSLVAGGTDTKEIAAPSGAANTWNVFIDGNVILAQDFSNNGSSLPYNSTTTGAVQIGADYKVTPHLLVGVTFGYGHTDATLDTIGSNANVDTYSPGIYMSYANNGWYYNALASYGFSSYHQQRDVNIGAFNGSAHSSPGGDQIIANLDGGYDFHKGNWTFGPTLGLQYVHLTVDGYSETGLPGADLTVNEDRSNSLRSRLGGSVSYAVKSGNLIFTPHLSASWQHEFMDEGRGITSQFSDVGAGSFVVNTANPSRDSALMDVGVDAQINDALTIFTDYSLQAGQSNYFGQSVQGGVKIGF